MLQDIRDNSQGVIAKVIIGFIIAIFALFGVESIIGGFIATPPVAEVNGEEINEVQLQIATQNLLNSIGGNAESLEQDLLEQIALNQLVEETLLRQLAEEKRMLVSGDRIDRSIIGNPNFQINGVFDPDMAVRTLASQGFNVPTYRETLRQQMAISQITNGYSRSNFITNAELQQIAELTAQSRDFRYLPITLGTRTLGTPVSDSAIAEYYSNNPDDFTKQESVILRYVMLDQDVIAEEIQLEEPAVRERYESERAAFEGSAEKRASHILFEISSSLPEEQAMEMAVAALERLTAGEDFAALALELSTDTASAQQGGDIGFSDGTVFPPEIETALEALTLNEVSAPVVTEFGVHLVKLTQDSENVFQSFEEVAERIEGDLKRAQVELLYAERLADLSNLAFETGDLETLSADLGLTILQSDEVTRNGGTGIFSNQAVLDAAFSPEVLQDGNNSEVIELNPAQSVVLRVQEFREASLLPMEEVEPEIAVILRTEMERNAVQALGDEILLALEAGADVQELLTTNELEWVQADATRRNSAVVSREILEEVFAMPDPAGQAVRDSFTIDNGTFVLVELNAVTPGAIASLSDIERTALSDGMLVDLSNHDFTAFLTNLRTNAEIQTQLGPDQLDIIE